MERTYDIIYVTDTGEVAIAASVGSHDLRDMIYRLKVCGNSIFAVYDTASNIVEDIMKEE